VTAVAPIAASSGASGAASLFSGRRVGQQDLLA
jgi:hypothetical protein